MDAKDLGLIGTKVGMTQVFDDEGNVVPVTAILVAENVVTEIKKADEKDGYNAVQIGNFETKEKHITKPLRVSLEKKELKLYKKLQEFRTHETPDLNIGDEISTEDFFKDLEKVDLTSFSIGKGFQGGVKAHNMHIGRRSHGSKSHRQIGSLGAGTYPGRVFKGKRMPKRLGNKKVTTTKVKVFAFDPETRVLLVKGPVSGKKGTEVTIKASGVKAWNEYNKKQAA